MRAVRRRVLRVVWAGGLCAAVATAWAVPAAAATLADLLGRRLTDVRVTAAARPVDDAAVLAVLETTVGEALSMADVRQTIDHLVALGRFSDIQVFAEEDGATGVRVRYAVVQVDRIVRIDVASGSGLPARLLLDTLDERFGARPAASRQEDMAAALAALYRQHGYAAARVELTFTSTKRPGQVVARVHATPGPQATVGRVTVDAASRTPEDVPARLGLLAGRPLDPEVLAERVRAFEEALRDRGDYEAIVTATPTEASPGVLDVTVRVDPGAPVRVEFTGDPLPADDRRTLVPIERLRSVEEEVVEDASRNIEQHFRLAGYRQASVRAERRREGGALVVSFAVSRGPLHEVRRVDVDGAAAMPRTAIEPLLKLPSGEPFVDARVGAVAAAIAELYRVRGFTDVRVTPRVSPSASAGDAPVSVDVRFEIVEGARTTVGSVRVDGDGSLPPQEVLAGLALTAGKPYYRPQHVLDREGIERRYRNLGFQRAAVDARTEQTSTPGVVDLVYHVSTGQQTTVDHILVAGTTRTSPELIRRELTLRQGGPLGYDALVDSQQRVSALGLFRRVRISEVPHGGSASSHDVLVEVEEASPTSVTVGGGLEVGRRASASSSGAATDVVDIAPRGFFEVTRRNLWGKNRSLSLLTSVSLRPTDPGVDAGPNASGGYGLNQYRVVGTLREPRLFDTRGDAQFSAFVERGLRSSFNFDRRGVRTEYARRLANRTTVLGRYAYDFTKLFDAKIATADQLLIDRLFPQVHVSSVFGSVLRDSRNDVLDPERGTVLGTDLELALRSLGSEVGFSKSFVQAFAYRRLPGSRPFVVAAGARVGLARGFDTRVPRLDSAGQPVLDANGTPIVDVVNDLPASERFFAGGDTTVRGFALDRLGSDSTLNSDGFPTGGNAMLVLNAELRTPHVKGVGLVGFVDGGNVFRRASELALGDLRATAGVGIRYRSPLGPLRFDIGFKLDRVNRGSESRAVYHLSLGQAF